MCMEIECYIAIIMKLLLEDKGVTNQNDMVVHHKSVGFSHMYRWTVILWFQGFPCGEKTSTCLLMYIILTWGKIYIKPPEN